MKRGLILSFLSLLVLICFQGTSHGQAQVHSDDYNSSSSFAVVELFTSEGCASCPPADKLLGEIVANAHENKKPVFALAFHVDYWDYIGWKDPYAKKAFSERQRRYARVFRANRIYTPQMIVNGTKEFVGSNRSKARVSVESALNKTADFTLFLEKSGGKESNQLEIEYNLSKLPEDAVLNLALVERGLVQNIGRGENSGMKLHHENVVRSFSSTKLKKKTGRIALEMPSSIGLDNCSIIGYVQNFSTMAVLAANGVEL